MPTTRARCLPTACAAVFSITLAVPLAAGPAAAVPPAPTPVPAVPGWLDEPVRSRDVACSVSVDGDDQTAGREVLAEHLACSVAMTDAMTGGALSADITVTFVPASSQAGTWTGTFAISRETGSWTGSGGGAAIRDAGGGAPALYGRIGYRGAGDCAGLSYTQLLTAGSGPAVFSGWVDGAQLPHQYEELANLAQPWVEAAIARRGP